MDASPGFAGYVIYNKLTKFYEINEKLGALAIVNFPGQSTLSTSKARNQAITCALNKSLKLQQSLLSGVFLGELGQALRMIRNPAMALRSGLSNYLLHLRRLRGQVRSPDSLLSLAGNLWLEYTFGWKPLINDIKDGARAIAENMNRSPFNANWAYVRCRGYERGNPVNSESSDAIAGADWKVSNRQYDESEVIVRACVRTYATHPVRPNLKSLGFTPEDFVPTVWNLIPYSFLVDYFTNIGDVLSAWSNRNSLLWWWNSTTIRKRTVQQFTYGYRRTNQPNAVETVISDNFTPASAFAQQRNVVRGSEPGQLIPAVEFTHPDFISLKWLNLAALGTQHRGLLPYRK
jgi:hypothetical protein